LQASVAPSLLYRTLSDAGSGPEPGRVHLQVVFADDITERGNQDIAQQHWSHDCGRPDPDGRLHLTLAADDREAPARTRETLALLRVHPKVRLAEAKRP
jgi:hypothetical protein